MPALLTEQFGRYRILKKLGQGGMGAVYLAEDTHMRRKVALKIPDFDGRENQTVIDRFYREARVAADIRHPGICIVYDVGCHEGTHYLTMAYIEGTPLADVLREAQPWPVARAVSLVIQIAEALQALHARGIVHRDLKPGNIMMEPDGRPVLLDFGLARSIQSASQMLTADGNSLGTPSYMAPEQMGGVASTIGPWSDVYALGVILFQLLTGRLPFQPASVMELYALVLHAARPRPTQMGITLPSELDLLCQTLIAIDPTQRPADMPTLIQRLRRWQTPVPAISAATQPLPVPDEGISTKCPSCDKRVRITSNMMGKKILCPGCRKLLPPPAPLAPVQLLEEVPELTEPIKPRRAPGGVADTQRAPERTQRRPGPAPRVRERAPRPRGGSGLMVGCLMVLLTAGAGIAGWYFFFDGESAFPTSPTSRTTSEPTKITNSIGMPLVWIPSGSFTMGSPETDFNRNLDELAHEVEISKGFYLGVYEVTQGEYQQVMGSNPSSFRPDGTHALNVIGLDTTRMPVETLTWQQATEFCQRLSDLPEEKQARRRYRLPTEAEWEYACRGGSKGYQSYHYGEALTAADANFDSAGYQRPVLVNDPQYRPNGFGLYHMHGNVYEWCQDYYLASYYDDCLTQGLRRDPQGPTNGESRVLRGGCWYGVVSLCRTAVRKTIASDIGYIDVGFRVVCERVP